MDDDNREALLNEAYYSILAQRLVVRLKELIDERDKPQVIRTDNGPEFISKTFTLFCQENNFNIQFIQPGKFAQDAYIERFNRTFREDILLFETI